MIEITIGKTLNPELWEEMNLNPEVREKLLEIANLSFEETYFNELLTIKNEHYLNSLDSLSMKNILPGVLMLLDKWLNHLVRHCFPVR